MSKILGCMIKLGLGKTNKKEGGGKMLKRNAAIMLIASLMLLAVSAATIVKAEETTRIWTDKSDYAPEETVTIYGTGFLPESLVTVEVKRPDLTVDSWSITSDSDGNFTTTYLLDGITGEYTIIAIDGTNTAATTFTDTQPYRVYFATDGLPAGVSIHIDYSYINPGGQMKNGDVTFNSPGPSDKQNTDPGSVFTYSGYPTSVSVGGTIYALISTSPASGFTTGDGGGSTTVTATYAQTYTITFTESGLPSSTLWSVTFNGVPSSSTSNTITFTGITAGSYSWSISTPISGGTGIQYVGSPLSGTMNVPTQTSQSITYTTQYELTMATNFGTTSPSVGGGHWYDAGTKVTISATAPVAGSGEQYVWNGWTGSGTGSYTGMDNPATDAVTMNGPITETASWTHQY
ncbi:MAG: hypothetical protein ACPL07_02795, partial [Candidatus Bathyarchaeia archaeon]